MASRAYLLIGLRLYIATQPEPGSEPHNLYPVSLGVVPPLEPGDYPWPTITASNGDTVTLFGRPYQINALPTGGTVEDEIDLELVALSMPGESEYEAESAAYDDYLTSLGSHVDGTEANDPCPMCNAADLILAGLEILSPDDCTISDIGQPDCGTVTFSVLSDDCGQYRVRVSVEIVD